MKNNWVILAILLFTLNLSQAQELISEDFSESDFPPAAWTISGHAENWKHSHRNIAGSEAPEAQLYFQPLFTDTTRLISPSAALLPGEDVRIEFYFAVEHHYPGYTIGLAVLKNEAWQSIWELQPDTNIQNTRVSLILDDSMIDDSLQLSWYFIGSVFDMYSWFIDDVRAYHPYERDVAAVSVSTEKHQYVAGETVFLNGKIENPGLTDAIPCEYNLRIKLEDETVFSETYTQNLPAGDHFEFALNDFTPTEENRIYDLILSTQMQNDQYSQNDTAVTDFNTYANERQQVLAEMATGTWCGTCPGAALGLDDLLLNGKSVSAIGYHVMDNYENAASLHRLAYYFIPAYPTVYFDGTSHLTRGHQFLSLYDDYLPIYEDKIQLNSPAELSIYGAHEGNDYEIHLAIEMNAKVRSEHLQVFLVLTESHIPEIWGGGGMEEVNHAARLMIPDHFGLPLVGEPGIYSFDLSFSLEENWMSENCELIAFIQDTLSFEVFQAEKVMLNELIPARSKHKQADIVCEIYPNPAEEEIHISLPQGTDIGKIRLFNIEGQLVKEWNSIGSNECNLHLCNEGNEKLSSGIYSLSLFHSKGFSRKKLIIQ